MKFLSFILVCVVALGLPTARAAAEDNLPVGTPVWVPVSHVEWGHGIVKARTPSGYSVQLDSGDSQNIDQEDIALDAVPQVKDLTGTARVIAKLSYGWFAGKITHIDGDTFTILFEDASTDEKTLDDLRLRLPPRPVVAAPVIAAPAAAAAVTATGTNSKTAAPAAGAPASTDKTAAAVLAETPGGLLAGIFAEARNKYTWVFSLKSPIVSKTLKYADKTVELEFIPMDEKQVVGPYTWSFWITNKTSAPISIDWEKSFVTSLSGKQRAVYHGDMKSIGSGPQARTTMEPGAKIGDAVTPKEGVILHHNNAHFDANGEWVKAWDQIDGYQMFFGDDFRNADEYAQVKTLVVGKEFKLSLALVVAGAPKQYQFVYKIDDITKVTDTTPSPLDAIH